MTDERTILVVGEFEDGKLTSLTAEMLGGAKVLADEAGMKVALLLAGEDAAAFAAQGFACGAAKVYAAASPDFGEYSPEKFISLVSKLCAETKPALCLIGQSELGRDIAPAVAARIGAGLCMDCVDVKFDAGKNCFLQTRPVYGGKALAVMGSANGATQIDTIRAKSLNPIPAREGAHGEVSVIGDFGIGPATGSKRTSFSRIDESGVRLEDAKVIVAGGGGLGGKEGFVLIKELADLLKGSVGATRVPVDEDWVPLSMEIGQTGKIVGPELYIAVGISGAAQHITGCLNSKTIISINKDPDANIFKISDFGLVADYKVALPVIIGKLKDAGI